MENKTTSFRTHNIRGAVAHPVHDPSEFTGYCNVEGDLDDLLHILFVISASRDIADDPQIGFHYGSSVHPTRGPKTHTWGKQSKNAE